MSSFKPNEPKREEFRRYLERAGVLDALTKVLVMLYEETDKPDDALEYIRKRIGGITEETVEVDELKKKLDESEAMNRELRKKLAKLEINDDNEAEE